jgi:alpha-1,3-mannosyltransferase
MQTTLRSIDRGFQYMFKDVLPGRYGVDYHLMLLITEFAICILVILQVKCELACFGLTVWQILTCFTFLDTEIDWKAYMQEVQGFEDGERDYTQIQGDTGPLVYPAGFLYVFYILKKLTGNGQHIVVAQFIFGVIYLVTTGIVMAFHSYDGAVPSAFSTALILSKRIHSIYTLRMFNDCVAVLFGYIGFLLFINKRWRAGSLWYSLAVSVKMNMLLYAPGVLLVLLMGTGIQETVVCLSTCALTQVVLGLPFLTTYPVQYLTKAFELSRVFTYKWTVNLKFFPEEVFVSKPLSLLLLGLTVVTLVAFALKWIREVRTWCALFG